MWVRLGNKFIDIDKILAIEIIPPAARPNRMKAKKWAEVHLDTGNILNVLNDDVTKLLDELGLLEDEDET